MKQSRLMRPGALRHRVSLERANTVPDGGGGESVTWEEIAPLWVAIEPKRGRETYEAGQLASKVSHEITMRYRTSVLPDMRFRKGQRSFHILAVIDVDEQRRWLRTLCEERHL